GPSTSVTFCARDDGTTCNADQSTGPVTFQCEPPRGTVFASCSSPDALNGLTQGANTFSVFAIDSLGNTGPTSMVTWNVDTTGPIVTFDSGTITDGSSSSLSTVVFAFHAN